MSQEEELANIGSELQFNVGKENDFRSQIIPEEIMDLSNVPKQEKLKTDFPIIFLDLQSDYFEKNLQFLPQGYNYKFINSLDQLNQQLKRKTNCTRNK